MITSFSTWACLYGGGGPQIGEVTCGRSPHLTCKMRYYTDRQVTSSTCGLPPPCKQALRDLFSHLAKKLTHVSDKKRRKTHARKRPIR